MKVKEQDFNLLAGCIFIGFFALMSWVIPSSGKWFLLGFFLIVAYGVYKKSIENKGG